MKKDVNRRAKKTSYRSRVSTGLDLQPIEPLTKNQLHVFESEKHMVLDGSAGTGKTFISMYLALDDIINKDIYSRLVIIRSNVETRKMGYLPGSDKEKIEVYEAPYIDIANELFSCGTAYDTLKSKGVVHFMPTSFLRGTTLRDAVIIVDECQNMTYHELDSIITRVGENCRIIFCGDYFQTDLPKETGILPFQKILKRMNDFDFIEFTTADIVRSEFVKNYLVTKYDVYGSTGVAV